MINTWYKSGTPWIWLNASAIAVSIVMVLGLLGYIGYKGLQHFWPTQIAQISLIERNDRGEEVARRTIIGEINDKETTSAYKLGRAVEGSAEDRLVTSLLIKIGNREINGMDFRWINADDVAATSYPEKLMTLERRDWGNFYGYLVGLKENGQTLSSNGELWQQFQARLDRSLDLFKQAKSVEKHEIGSVNYQMEKLRLRQKRLQLDGDFDAQAKAEIEREYDELNQQYKGMEARLVELNQRMNRDSILVATMNDEVQEIELSKIVRAFRPNNMSSVEKWQHYFSKVGEFIFDDPREANMEGGVFPAIFGTVAMVLLMTVMVTPFGVVAAIYLREYAKQGFVTRLVRIAVNNLAGVPSIVYGVFGLGFFVYFLGGNIDALFYPEAAPAPVFSSPGLLWASLTLAILTVPVVIVATEEGLSRIPITVREGSLALGATKAETLWRVILPMSSPAIMTGVILAIARAAGEVAPLMLVGVVKLAPELPLDANFPFVHLERKFMHLGFHIYDVGFQSPNVEAARPLVFATAFLLVLVIVGLNLAAVRIRNNLREQYKALES